MASSLAGFSLFLAFAISLAGVLAGTYSGWNKEIATYRVLRRSILIQPLLIGTACTIMITAFVNSWMNFEYVATNSSKDLSFLYKITGLWSGQSGSLLFWSMILSVYGLLIFIQTHNEDPSLFVTGTLTALGIIQAFFLFLINWVTYPFTRLWKLPDGSIVSAATRPPEAVMAMVEGNGLNPVLQHPGMAIHPPMLYLGYIGLSIPFCFAVGALVSGRLGDEWIHQSRLWTMLSWTILSFGIVLGGWWAYQELGWGGYWAWDPVENASFMPWLMATAFVHSVMIQKRRGMLKRWNVILVSLAFLLSIFGTFLTRSGLLNSVHSFAKDPVIGSAFLGFIGVLLIAIVGLVLYRYRELESENELESILSREFAFLLNNMLFVGICFAVLWGTIYPIISEYLTGDRITLGPSFYNQVTLPMFLCLLILTGIGPLISWRKASVSNLIRNFTGPVLVAMGVTLTLLYLGYSRWMPVASFAICGFVLSTVFMEFYRGTQARKRSTGEPFLVALVKLSWKARARFGGYIVHVGVLMMVVGITASSAYDIETSETLNPGETVEVRHYQLTFDRVGMWPMDSISRTDERFPKQCGDSINCKVRARFSVSASGSPVGTLRPGVELLTTTKQPRSRVDIRSTWHDDLYLVLTSWTKEGDVTVKIFHNPLVNWIWIGVLVLLFGGLFALIP
ncbi:MAG: heme lyase CcmF/NrfE family subunit [bacterium]